MDYLIEKAYSFSLLDDNIFDIPEVKKASWDNFFMSMAKTMASRSKCLSRKVGAVAVKENVILSSGYNGPPRNIPTCDHMNKPYKHECPRRVQGYSSGEGLHLCGAVHAEANLAASAARMGVSLKDTAVYIYAGVGPCSSCTGILINMGIKEIIIPSFAHPYDDMTEYLLKYSNVVLRSIPFHEIT